MTALYKWRNMTTESHANEGKILQKSSCGRQQYFQIAQNFLLRSTFIHSRGHP